MVMLYTFLLTIFLVGPLQVSQPVPQPKLTVAKPVAQPTLHVVQANPKLVSPLQAPPVYLQGGSYKLQ